MKYFIILGILASILANNVFADDEPAIKKARWYQINVTFFQQKTDRSLDESFNYNKIELTMANVIRLYKDDNTFTLANSGINAPLSLHHENANALAFTMQNIDNDWADIINKLDPVSQSILFNAQWVQPVYDQQHSMPIYIESSSQVLNQPQLKGLFNLHVSRYLHSKIELQFIPENADSLKQTLSLKQSRRMRSKEVHYIDHPSLGVLIRILPIQHPLDKEAEELKLKLESITEPVVEPTDTAIIPT
ncbi:MAG: hypothetical protein ACJAYK_001842 [Crocinitomicaceae bacterium]|jgi:hypothetical protein